MTPITNEINLISSVNLISGLIIEIKMEVRMSDLGKEI